MDQDTVEMRLTIEAADRVSDARMGADTGELLNHLSRLRLGKVDVPSAGPAPAGAKSGLDVMALNQLVISVASSGAAVAIVQAVKEWLSQRARRKVVLEIGDNKVSIEGDWGERDLKAVDALARRYLKK